MTWHEHEIELHDIHGVKLHEEEHDNDMKLK